MNRILVAGFVVAICLMPSNKHDLHAQQPEWTGRILKVGIDRQYTDSLDILERPYRPFHFYGNTVRRMHYRGFPLPLPRDFVMSANAIVTQRDLWFADSPTLGLAEDINPNNSEPNETSENQDVLENATPASANPARANPPQPNQSSQQSEKLKATQFASSIIKIAPKPGSLRIHSTQSDASARPTSNVAKIIANSIIDIQSSDAIQTESTMRNHR